MSGPPGPQPPGPRSLGSPSSGLRSSADVDARRAELAAGLAGVESRLVAACAAAGRSRSEVLLVAVTKTFPATDVALLAGLGVTDVAENRDQEAAAKAYGLTGPAEPTGPTGPGEVAAEPAGPVVRWHFVGQLQRNKCRSVAGWAAMVHSVDRPELVPALERAVQERGATLDVLVQVSLDEPPSADAGRGGAAPTAVPALVERVLATETLRLRGVMAVAPYAPEPDAAFARLAVVAQAVRAVAPTADVVSAGTSADLEAAVRHGSTLVRVGTALLGRRPPPGG